MSMTKAPDWWVEVGNSILDGRVSVISTHNRVDVNDGLMTTGHTSPPATPGIGTTATCTHWWARRGHIHECGETLHHGGNHRCVSAECGEEQGR